MALEGFKTKFPENQNFSEKLYKWLKSQSESGELDLDTFVLSMELLTKPKSEIYVQSHNFKNLEQFQLVLLISILNADVLKKDEFKNQQLSKIEITYL